MVAVICGEYGCLGRGSKNPRRTLAKPRFLKSVARQVAHLRRIPNWRPLFPPGRNSKNRPARKSSGFATNAEADTEHAFTSEIFQGLHILL